MDCSRVILCMKWGTKYGPEYVNRLYGMVARHLHSSFSFVCLTDNSAGIRGEVLCRPIPGLGLPEGIPERGWKKLTTFSRELADLGETALFLDLDVVIVGDLDAFFDLEGDFYIIHDWKRPWRITGNSSVYRFRIGAHCGVLDHFEHHQESIRKRLRNEQAYLSERMAQLGTLRYWPQEWCRSFKYHCIPGFPRNWWKTPVIPDHARILVFHGEVNPPDALIGRRNRWAREGRPAPWIEDHWRA